MSNGRSLIASLRLRAAAAGRGRAALGLLGGHLDVHTSQYGEDVLIEKLLRPGRSGTYVDVGANHPVWGSNTYRLYLKGWSGLAIDPNPAFARSFRKLRPEDRHLTLGVSNAPGALTYFEFAQDQLNTLCPARAADLVGEGHKVVRETRVETRPLREIVERELAGRPIDLLTVDVEGLDLEVLLSLDLETHRPSVMVLEDFGRFASFSSGSATGPFEAFFRRHGYQPIAQTAWSCIVVARDWRILFARSAAFDPARIQTGYLPA